jgi:spore coat polysaccharide biosynthesis protein SpsF
MNSMKKIIAIIQARMGSSRLPGKVMMEICKEPMLAWVVKRTRNAKMIKEIVVATTREPSDNEIEKFCQSHHITCYRGSSTDVLDRYYQTAKLYQADVIVRITADCPLIDPELIDNTIATFLGSLADFTANRLPPPFQRTYPIGLDVEVVSMAALERAWKESTALYEREHVMPYIYERKDQFRILTIENEDDYGTYRWTVDTREDLDFIHAVVKEFGCRMDFSWKDVIELLKRNPELMQINAQVRHKSFTDVDLRVKTKKKNK